MDKQGDIEISSIDFHVVLARTHHEEIQPMINPKITTDLSELKAMGIWTGKNGILASNRGYDHMIQNRDFGRQ